MSVQKIPASLYENDNLWRYMKLSSLLLLMEGKAFFPSVATLQKNEPLEGYLYCEYPWIIGALQDHGKERAWNDLSDWLHNRAERQELGGDLTGLLARRYVKELLKRRAAWCWYQSHNESAAMWSIYGHAGVAVCTTGERLKAALPQNQDFRIAQVNYYSRDFVSFNPADEKQKRLILRPHLMKSIEFKHEEEIRVVTHCNPHSGGELVEEIDFPKLITKIVISPLLPIDEADAIRRLFEERIQPGCIIERSTLLGDQISLDETKVALRKYRKQKNTSETGLPEIFKYL